eukprot:1062277-Rhodomonas_salina.1
MHVVSVQRKTAYTYCAPMASARAESGIIPPDGSCRTKQKTRDMASPRAAACWVGGDGPFRALSTRCGPPGFSVAM